MLKTATKIASVALTAMIVADNIPAGDERGRDGELGWAEIEAALGATNFIGTLRYEIQLPSSTTTIGLGLRSKVVHYIDTGKDGNGVSRWRVPGLFSALVPAGREFLLWTRPSGAAVRFKVPTNMGEGVRLGESGIWSLWNGPSGVLEVRSDGGEVWQYRSGRLLYVAHPLMGTFTFNTRGAWILEMREIGAGENRAPELVARYNDNGQIVSWTVSGRTSTSFTYDAMGKLVSVVQDDGVIAKFEYRNKLLWKISEKGVTRRLVWMENPWYKDTNGAFGAPVQLVKDGNERYSYNVSRRGIEIRRWREDKEADVITIFNPFSRVVEQYIGDERRRVQLLVNKASP